MRRWVRVATPVVAAVAAAVVATAGAVGGTASPTAPEPTVPPPAVQPTAPAADASSGDEIVVALPHTPAEARGRTQRPLAGSEPEADAADGVGEDAGGGGDAGEPDDAGGDDVLRVGDRGEAVESLQLALNDLGYWLGQPDGVYGELTRQAVLAFQGAEGLARDGIAGPQVHAALDDPGGLAPTVHDGIEIDRGRQLLTVVADGQVRWRLHTSTGHGGHFAHPDGGTRIAVTPAGEFTITRRIDGWRDAPLGRLYRPAYFNGGIAIHGYSSVPAHAASSGCARVSVAAMDLLWREGAVAPGQQVVVH